MAADKYRSAEDQYFRLRGYFDTGRLTQDQFDEKLRELMIQDEQGRYWTLGADSGKWYYYDGAKWIQGEPPTAGASAGAGAAAIMPPPPEADPVSPIRPAAAPPPMARAPTPPPPVTPPTQYTEPRSFPIGPILLVLLLILIGVGAFFAYQNRNRLFVAQNQPQITPILPATITRAPSPTAPVLAATTAPVLVATTAPATAVPSSTTVPTAIPSTDVPTNVPVPTDVPATAVPGITVVVVTSEPIATIVPPASPTATNRPPTVPPTATKVPFTPTATTIPPTSTPSLPPGIYVTAVTLSPSAPRRNQEISFQATFVNTSGATQGYNWLIQIYDPNKAGTNKRFGESEIVNISVPPGTTQFTVKYPGVKGAGGCVDFYAQAEWQNADKSRTPFQDGNGHVLQTGFQVCPA